MKERLAVAESDKHTAEEEFEKKLTDMTTKHGAMQEELRQEIASLTESATDLTAANEGKETEIKVLS